MNENLIMKARQSLNNYFVMIFSIQLILIVIVLLLASKKIFSLEIATDQEIKIFIMLYNFALVIAIKSVEKKIKSRLNNPTDFKTKLDEYKKGTIIIIFVFLLANVFNLAAFLITIDYIYIVIFTIIFLLNFAYRPTKNIMESEYKIK